MKICMLVTLKTGHEEKRNKVIYTTSRNKTRAGIEEHLSTKSFNVFMCFLRAKPILMKGILLDAPIMKV